MLSFVMVIKVTELILKATGRGYQNTAEPAYSRLQGSEEFCLLKEKSTTTGIE